MSNKRIMLFALACAAAIALGSAPSTSRAQSNEIARACFPNAYTVYGALGTNVARVEVTCANSMPSTGNAAHDPYGGPNTVNKFAVPDTDANYKRFVRLVHVARSGGLPLVISYLQDGSNRFNGCNDQTCRRPTYFGLSKQPALCPAYNPHLIPTVGNTALDNFCTPGCPCQVGQGDCDSNADCAGDLVCRAGSGTAYRLPATVDTCQPRQCTPGVCNPSAGCLCFAGEACTSDDDCAGMLICDGSTHRCRACAAADQVQPGDADGLTGCSRRCGCDARGGDCDPDTPEKADTPADSALPSAQCSARVPGNANAMRSRLMYCAIDVGARYGKSAETDICLPIYESKGVP